MKGNRTKCSETELPKKPHCYYIPPKKRVQQTKKRATRTLGARDLPSNREVAEELDRIAEEREGNQRKDLLLR